MKSCCVSGSALGSDHGGSSGISWIARVLHQRAKRRGCSPVSHVTPLQPTSHSQEPSPSIPLLHFPWTQVHAAGREKGGRHCPRAGWQRAQQGKEGKDAWPRHLLPMAPSALAYFKKCFGLCLLASTYRVDLNLKYAYLSSIPECRDWNCVLMGKHWWKSSAKEDYSCCLWHARVGGTISKQGIREKIP